MLSQHTYVQTPTIPLSWAQPPLHIPVATRGKVRRHKCCVYACHCCGRVPESAVIVKWACYQWQMCTCVNMLCWLCTSGLSHNSSAPYLCLLGKCVVYCMQHSFLYAIPMHFHPVAFGRNVRGTSRSYLETKLNLELWIAKQRLTPGPRFTEGGSCHVCALHWEV